MLRGLARQVASASKRQVILGTLSPMRPFMMMRMFADSQHKAHPDVQERVMELSRRFLEKVKEAKIDKLTPAATFEELGMDSLDSVDFIVVLEESFGFDVTNEDAENRIRSIKDACEVFSEYIEKRAAEAKGQNKA